MVNCNFMPDLRVLQLRPISQPILCLSLSYFGENDLTCIQFVYFDHQEATVVVDITIQFVASAGNKYSVAS